MTADQQQSERPGRKRDASSDTLYNMFPARGNSSGSVDLLLIRLFLIMQPGSLQLIIEVDIIAIAPVHEVLQEIGQKIFRRGPGDGFKTRQRLGCPF